MVNTRVDLTEYRAREIETARIDSLFDLIPKGLESALDVGARDGFLSLLLAKRFESVTALDLDPVHIDHPAIKCVRGDVCALDFEDNAFDVVLCAEVLEHIPTQKLSAACAELARVCKRHLVIGVPYKQDTRVGRTTCQACGHRNPPWGHVNVFDEDLVQAQFRDRLSWDQCSYVGETRLITNPLSMRLLDWAGNPYGTYNQQEPCVACGSPLRRPEHRTFLQRLATRGAYFVSDAQEKLASPRPNWMHVRLSKAGLVDAGGASHRVEEVDRLRLFYSSTSS